MSFDTGSFDFARALWQIANLFIFVPVLLLSIGLPVFLAVKINSIDKVLKQVLKKLEEK